MSFIKLKFDFQFFIIQTKKDPENDENLNKLKASYETLMKFSFLTQDEEQFTKEIAMESRDHLQNIYMLAKVSTLSNKHLGLDSLNQKSFYKRNKDFYGARKSPPDSIPEDEEEFDETVINHEIETCNDKPFIRKASIRSKLAELALMEENEENEDEEEENQKDIEEEPNEEEEENHKDIEEEPDEEEASPFDKI